MRQRVLVIRFSAFGDLVLTTGPLRQLKKKYPGLEIDLLSSEIGEELFTGSIEIDQKFILPKNASLGDLFSLYRKLPKYDIVIDWQGNFKSYLVRLFVKANFYSIEKHSRLRRQFVKDKQERPELKLHVVEKYYGTLQRAFDLPELTVEELRPFFITQPITFAKDVFDIDNSVAIHMYASQDNKVWPYFNELILELHKKNIPTLLIGSTVQLGEFKESPLLMDLRNKTTLRELSAVLKKCRALVTTDSGPMHVGIAVNTPTIAIFGPTTKEFGFYPKFANSHVIENNKIECRPCHVHGGHGCPLVHHDCMKTIKVNQVLDQIEKF